MVISQAAHMTLKVIMQINGISRPILNRTPDLRNPQHPKSNPTEPDPVISSPEKEFTSVIPGEHPSDSPRKSPIRSPLPSPKKERTPPVTPQEPPVTPTPSRRSPIYSPLPSPKTEWLPLPSPVRLPSPLPSPNKERTPPTLTPKVTESGSSLDRSPANFFFTPIIPSLDLSKTLNPTSHSSTPAIHSNEEENFYSLSSRDPSPSATPHSSSPRVNSPKTNEEAPSWLELSGDILETLVVEEWLTSYDSLEEAMEYAFIIESNTRLPKDEDALLKDLTGDYLFIWAEEKIYYQGEIQNGKLHGKGAFISGLPSTVKNALLIEGQFDGNQLVSGWLKSPNGRNLYEGTFEEGELNGTGSIKFADHSGSHSIEYRGEFKDGQPDGLGRVIHHTINDAQIIEEGNYQKGILIEGRRVVMDTLFEGEFKANALIKGKIAYPDGRFYEGEVLDDVPHGKGKLTTPYLFNANGYEARLKIQSSGIFESGKEKELEDTFHVFWSDGLSGTMRLGDNPELVFTIENGPTFTMEVPETFEDIAFINGKGTIRSLDGDEYAGEIRNCLKHGVGELKYADGRVLKGRFEENEFIE